MPNETFYDGMKIELKHNYREIVSEEIIFALESIPTLLPIAYDNQNQIKIINVFSPQYRKIFCYET